MSLLHSTAFINFATVVVLIVASGFLGHWLGKALRAVDYGWKFGVILFAVFASVVVLIRGWPPKLGVDLGGGSILVYKVDETQDRLAARQDGFAAGLDQQTRQSRRTEGNLGKTARHRHGGNRHAVGERKHGRGEAG